MRPFAPLTFFPAILFGAKPGQMHTVEGQRFIRHSGGRWYPIALLAGSAHYFEGAPVRLAHPDQGTPHYDVGRVVEAGYRMEERSLHGIIEIFAPHTARQIEELLSKGTAGLSPMWLIHSDGPRVTKIIGIEAVDFCEEAFSAARVLKPTRALQRENLRQLVEFGSREEIAEAVLTMPPPPPAERTTITTGTAIRPRVSVRD